MLSYVYVMLFMLQDMEAQFSAEIDKLKKTLTSLEEEYNQVSAELQGKLERAENEVHGINIIYKLHPLPSPV